MICFQRVPVQRQQLRTTIKFGKPDATHEKVVKLRQSWRGPVPLSSSWPWPCRTDMITIVGEAALISAEKPPERLLHHQSRGLSRTRRCHLDEATPMLTRERKAELQEASQDPDRRAGYDLFG